MSRASGAHRPRRKRSERRDPQKRLADRINFAVEVLAVCCMLVFGAGGILELHRISADEHHRLTDLQRACERTSLRSVADVNLNWVYYLSERQLADGARGDVKRILLARATADFDAARVKAQSIDYLDAGQIRAVTALGGGLTPRRWVLQARFSCTRAYH